MSAKNSSQQRATNGNKRQSKCSEKIKDGYGGMNSVIGTGNPKVKRIRRTKRPQQQQQSYGGKIKRIEHTIIFMGNSDVKAIPTISYLSINFFPCRYIDKLER